MTVPVPPDLFVGLVTHTGSRFEDSAKYDGLGMTIVRTFAEHGITAILTVIAEDLWTPETLPIDRLEVARSIDAEFDSERRWRSYVSGGRLTASERLVLSARRLKRKVRLLPVTRRSLRPDDSGSRSTRRLANIELSHLTLMREAARSGSGWVLILEDDAWAPDAAKFAIQLACFLQMNADTRQPVMVSLSESFTPAQLGIEHLLTKIDRPANKDTSGSCDLWNLWQADRPVTNTVCATLYRGEFLASLIDTLEAIPLSPVVPIDFKLNEALMRLAPAMRPGDCWIAQPAPLDQRSGVPQVRR